ncbi:MAG: 50S ribosomal protein L11 methyltransferase [Alphaproteobacteria bacterium]|nr:50S ribosomal protein L11 methyltransferase [Alphaproteobacteria bacterium]
MAKEHGEESRTAFIREHTIRGHGAIVPEIGLRLVTEVMPLWEATEAELETEGLGPPFWAICWPGGQALARHILDNPETVRGRRVIDLAGGCGIAGIAAAIAGAQRVTLNDIDPFACAAMAVNAEENAVTVAVDGRDLLDDLPGDADVILAGDVCYEDVMSSRMLTWLRRQAGAGATVLMGDPGRSYAPEQGVVEIAKYPIRVSKDVEKEETLETVVWKVLAA